MSREYRPARIEKVTESLLFQQGKMGIYRDFRPKTTLEQARDISADESLLVRAMLKIPQRSITPHPACLLYTSDAADE